MTMFSPDMYAEAPLAIKYCNALEVLWFSPVAHRDSTRDEVEVGFQLRIGAGVFVDVCLDIPAPDQYPATNTRYTIHNTQYTIHNTQYTTHNTQHSKSMIFPTHPGDTQLTRIPFPAHSLLSARVSCNTPPLLAAYAAILTPPCIATKDATLIMTPRCS